MLSVLLFLYTVLVFNDIFVLSQGDAMMGKGVWNIENLEKCDKDLPMKLNITMEAISRTLYGFDMSFYSPEPITEMNGVIIYVCKHVDGGCKDYQTITDDSMERLGLKYVPEMFVDILIKLGVDGGELPIPSGDFEVLDYVIDHCMFPSECVYGKFDAYVNLMKGNDEFGCVKVTIEFLDDESDCPASDK